MKHSHIMVSKLTLIIVIFLLSSCKRVENAWNGLIVNNSTSDTLVMYMNESAYHIIPPNDHVFFSKDLDYSGLDLIRENHNREKDTVKLFRNDILLVKWGAPLSNLHDSIHSFYNENSWVITNGGRKNEYIIATFTISEDDFKQDD